MLKKRADDTRVKCMVAMNKGVSDRLNRYSLVTGYTKSSIVETALEIYLDKNEKKQPSMKTTEEVR